MLIQAGAKLKAMRALIRSGETEKVCLFAQVSRNRELYIMAANYLQTRDWHSDLNLLKQIIVFYEKARAYEQLAAFYGSCAHYEIDECQQFEKALDALHEAQRCLARMLQAARAGGKGRSAEGARAESAFGEGQAASAVNETALEARLRELDPHISNLQMFCDARRYVFRTCKWFSMRGV